MDGLFHRIKLCLPLLSYLLPYSERSIALVKRLAGSPKGAEIDPNLPQQQSYPSEVAQ
jgi:hypothetical protein